MSKTNDASLIDETEIIDVSSFDFDDNDTWLYIPVQCQTERIVYDLYTWLRSEPELALSVNRKSIDTRTFTRPKKRSSRNCFESIFESSSPSVPNAWKTLCSNFSNIEEDLKYSNMSTANREEVPPMLKTASTISSNLLFDENTTSSGQESMEVFLNMSHSKGNDSFINLIEPGLGDPLMNVSQPSIFYSSITSLPREDSLPSADYDREEEPANLTQLLHCEIYRNDDSKNSIAGNTFLKVDDEPDGNRSYCIIPADRTFTNKSIVIEPAELNETYTAEGMSTTLVLSDLDKKKCNTSTLSSTFVNEGDENRKILQVDNKKTDEFVLNSTYTPTSRKADESFHLDATYSAMEIEKPNKDVTITHKDRNQPSQLQRNSVYNIPKSKMLFPTPQANSSFSILNDIAPDSTFKLSIPLGNQSTPKNMEALNTTFKAMKNLEQPRIQNTGLSGNFKAPMSLRRELLAEIHRSGEHIFDTTYNHVSNEHHDETVTREVVEENSDQNNKCDVPVENKYNTYKKESVNKVKPQAEVTNEPGAGVHDLPDKKYYTFTKKSNVYGGKTDMENAESLDNMDATFVKPLPKLQKKKQHIPRMLSRLPQTLQKSNPNLLSGSLKAVNMTSTHMSGNGFRKGSQPNIVRDVEKTLGNKLYSLGKVKSGSEQRLLELNTAVGELQLMGAGGSTESIESTQSAHSAPDLDDRLSTCSDSSHNSYTVRPMNLEQLQQIVRMQEESLKQGAMPQITIPPITQCNRRVLESTWIEGRKDLHSPILKNGIDSCESNSTSPLSMDFTVKTSSPILSPMRSSQTLNTDGHPTENRDKPKNDTVVKKVDVLNNPTMKVENKTRLRQPTNWSTGSRPSNMLSAIPRPPSRIPAPRFVRPVTKNIQDNIKRG